MNVIEVNTLESRVAFWAAWDSASANPWWHIRGGWFRPAFLFTFNA